MRKEEDQLLGLALNPRALSGNRILDEMTSDAITCRERSTLFGLLRRWPQFERRLHSRSWDGTERRASRISGPHHV